jgi:hypothetical protein
LILLESWQETPLPLPLADYGHGTTFDDQDHSRRHPE